MQQVPTSFSELVERHRTEILGYLVRLLGNREDAQDACQDALLRAHRAFGRLAPGSNPRAWLYRIATNSGRNVARGRSRATRRIVELDVDALPGSAGAEDGRERLQAVARAAIALPPRQRAALVLRKFQDLGYAEIAASLGGSEAAARANVYQAIRKLRSALGGRTR